jgi:hypothetical protein
MLQLPAFWLHLGALQATSSLPVLEGWLAIAMGGAQRNNKDYEGRIYISQSRLTVLHLSAFWLILGALQALSSLPVLCC